MKKIICLMFFCLSLSFGGQDSYGSSVGDSNPTSSPAKTSKSPMLDFMNSLDWDIFYDKFKIELEACICDNSTSTIAGVAIPLGFKASLIEPILGVSSSNQPGDLVGLNIDLGHDLFDKEGTSREGAENTNETTLFRQINFVTFPFMAMVGFVLPEAICFDKTTEMTSVHISDIDPLYQNDILSLAVNTGKSWGRTLLINPLADLACVADCAAATAGYPINSLYWCDGCRGNVGATDTGYTKTGDPIENSEMIIFRQVAAMHETSRLLKTSNATFAFLPKATSSKNGVSNNNNSSSKKNGGKETSKTMELPNTMCGDKTFPLIIKDQYYLQLAYGKAKPFGAMRFHYDFKSTPNDNDRFFFWLWRVRDYCFGQTHCK